MTADPTTTLAAHQAELRARGGDSTRARAVCSGCEWQQAERSNLPDAIHAHAEHVLAVLAQEGWAVVRADVVETVAELDALPFMAVIREQIPLRPVGSDHSRVWEKWRQGEWMCVGGRTSYTEDPVLPCTVLYRPTSGVAG